MGLLSSRLKSFLNHRPGFSNGDIAGVSLGNRLQFMNSDGLYTAPANNKGKAWFVDSVSGSASNGGTSWDDAVLTLAAAVALATSGDTIYCQGTFTLTAAIALSTTACAGSTTAAGLSIIGVGNSVNQTLIQSNTVDINLFTVTVPNVRFQNIRFRPSARSAGAPAAISLSGATYTQFLGCKFQGRTGAYYGILSDGTNDNTIVQGCEFAYFNTATNGAAIFGTGYVGGSDIVDSSWIVQGCIFRSNLRSIHIRGRNWIISDNVVEDGGVDTSGGVTLTSTQIINLSGTNSGANLVTRNMLGGTYSIAGHYVAGASADCWFGNYTSAGLSAASPS